MNWLKAEKTRRTPYTALVTGRILISDLRSERLDYPVLDLHSLAHNAFQYVQIPIRNWF